MTDAHPKGTSPIPLERRKGQHLKGAHNLSFYSLDFNVDLSAIMSSRHCWTGGDETSFGERLGGEGPQQHLPRIHRQRRQNDCIVVSPQEVAEPAAYDNAVGGRRDAVREGGVVSKHMPQQPARHHAARRGHGAHHIAAPTPTTRSLAF